MLAKDVLEILETPELPETLERLPPIHTTLALATTPTQQDIPPAITLRMGHLLHIRIIALTQITLLLGALLTDQDTLLTDQDTIRAITRQMVIVVLLTIASTQMPLTRQQAVPLMVQGRTTDTTPRMGQ